MPDDKWYASMNERKKMPKFRKKPVVIEAVRWNGNNKKEIFDFVKISCHQEGEFFEIYTLEGRMTAQSGDWIIKGVAGEFYPCKPDIFEKTYEPVE